MFFCTLVENLVSELKSMSSSSRPVTYLSKKERESGDHGVQLLKRWDQGILSTA